jgi:hypothetical protein
VLLEFLASVVGVAGFMVEERVRNVSCCCANAHSVVGVFGVRGGSSGTERCVLRAGGGPVAVSIPLLLCDAGFRLARLFCIRVLKADVD